MARPALRIEVTSKDRKRLRELHRGGVQQVRVVLRALALSKLAQGLSAPRISSVIPLTPQAIRKVGHRYQEGGLERALYEKERPGAAEVLNDSQKRRIIALVSSDPPEGRARWTVRLVVEQAIKRKLVPRVGRETIRVLLLHHELKPWRKKRVVHGRTWMKTTLPRWRPLWRRMNGHTIRSNQWCVCMRSRVRRMPIVRPFAAAQPGREARRNNEYERCGTVSLVDS